MFAMLFVCNMIARGVQAMPDHSVLDTLREVPPEGIRLMFWRRSCETLTRHRCPVFDDSIGLTFEIMMGDVLHCLYLGTFQSWLAAAFAKNHCSYKKNHSCCKSRRTISPLATVESFLSATNLMSRLRKLLFNEYS